METQSDSINVLIDLTLSDSDDEEVFVDLTLDYNDSLNHRESNGRKEKRSKLSAGEKSKHKHRHRKDQVILRNHMSTTSDKDKKTTKSSTDSSDQLYAFRKKAKPSPSKPVQLRVYGAIQYLAPEVLTTMQDIPFCPILPSKSTCYPKEECPICLEDLTEQIVKLNVCTHRFHQPCLEQTMAANIHHPACPICRRSTKEPLGKSPSGTMSVATSEQKCLGISDVNTIVITYTFLHGFQKSYNVQPGAPFRGIKCTAYLPNNTAGRDLQTRIVYAFRRGLSFLVGTVPGTDICVLGICPKSHNSSIRATPISWTDPNYFQTCNKELDALSVPAACALELPKEIVVSEVQN